MWLYQLSNHDYPLAEYRREIWEGQLVEWPTRRIVGTDDFPRPGDRMALWYAQKHAEEPGLVGWGLVLGSSPDEDRFLWRPIFPADGIKMAPLFDDEMQELIDEIRGPQPQGTMWWISPDAALRLSARIRTWFCTA
jgi:hypothetical protein